MATSESMIQIACVAWFRDTYPDYIIAASLNGVKLSGKNKYGVIEKQRKEGMEKGFPDLEVILPKGKTIHIEMKKPGGKQSKEQIDIQSKLEELGHKYYLCFSFQEFKEIVEESVCMMK